LKRSKPMKRSGFSRRVPLGVDRDAKVVAEGGGKVVVEETVQTGPGSPFWTPPPTRTASYGGGTSGIALPKNPRLECPALLELARTYLHPCLIAVQCDGHMQHCVACHGNGYEWNKGMRMKAHDFFSVWGCARCHTWLDSSYSASHEQREAAFKAALRKQILEWSRMAGSPYTRPREREAVTWALHHLLDHGYAVRNADARFPFMPTPHA
jgi:hypothetical protein